MRDLPHILNWRRLDDTITTSGQPTEDQLADIKGLSVTHIINLGPHHNDGALPDEAGTVKALDMEYIYIPVEFENPTEADFDRFCSAIEGLRDTQVHVHCIYNARVSAFFYRYAKTGRTIPPVHALAIMDGIWKPGNDWAAFLSSEDAVDQPNCYAGHDY